MPRQKRSKGKPAKKREYKYNEKRPDPPKHRYAKGQDFSFYTYPGASSRLLLERVFTSFEAIRRENLQPLGISSRDRAKYRRRDFVRYRLQVRDALLAILREGPGANDGRIRGGAVAYIGALEFPEGTDVLAGMATSPAEPAEIRGLAIEALGRLGGDAGRLAAREALADPHPAVRERAARALGSIALAEDGKLLAERANFDGDAEVRQQAASAAQRLLPKSLQHLLPDLERQRRTSEARNLIPGENITRPIGRHVGPLPQTQWLADTGAERIGMAGGRDFVREQRAQPAPPAASPTISGYDLLEGAPPNFIRLQLIGRRVPATFCSPPHARVYRLSEEEAVVDLPREAVPMPGRPLPLCPSDSQQELQMPTWAPQAPPSPVIREIGADRPTIWAGEEFALQVRFWAPEGQRDSLLRLEVQLPLGAWSEGTFIISETEQAVGQKVVPGYVSSIAGPIRVRAAIYAENGGAAKAEAQLQALPTNPISMTVVPQATGTNGEGPAHYNAAEDRFYCYAGFNVSNGFPYAVTVGPTVTCRVTDGGDHVATFSFSIGTSTIPANSARSIYVYTWHGSSSDVYDVFEDFGDVRMDFTLQTSEGAISNWHVWAAMAQVKLALNFVGSMSASTRATFQDIVENEASAIYEQQSLYISETQRFLLPSSDPDWNRYRDIRMDDNKDQDCTSGSDEADDLRDDWSSPTPWLDVWIVESFSGPACAASVGGFSPVDGPTAKGGDDSGVVIQLAGVNLSTTFGRNLMGIIVAHEVAHFLELEHVSDSSNFMAASTGGTNTDVTHGQYRDMADHGFVERFVP